MEKREVILIMLCTIALVTVIATRSVWPLVIMVIAALVITALPLQRK